MNRVRLERASTPVGTGANYSALVPTDSEKKAPSRGKTRPPAEGPETGLSNARAHWIAWGKQQQEALERRSFVGFVIESVRRFVAIEGKRLTLVITANLFIAVIPLLIVGYSLVEAFNPHRNVGVLIVDSFHLSGNTAQLVEETFSNAGSGKSAALSISLISLLITGTDVGAAVQLAYARAFEMTPMRGLQKYLRGGAWLVVLLAMTGVGLSLRYWQSRHSVWFAIPVGLVLLAGEFGFFLATPRLLLDLPFAWRDLVPGAAICAGAAIIVNAVTSYSLHKWFGEYGHAYGGFGVALALISAVGITASFWVWVAAAMGVYWQRRAGSATVAAMEELSAEVGRS